MSKQAGLRILIGALTVAWLVCLIGCWNYSLPGSQGDDAAYWHMAVDLAMQGKLKTIEAYLPGWSIFASPFVYLGVGVSGMRVLSACLAGASSMILYQIFSKRISPWLAVLLSAQFLFNSVSLRLATTTMSEHCFSFLIFLSLYLWDLGKKPPLCTDKTKEGSAAPVFRSLVAAFCGFVSGFAGLVRVVGLPMTAALFLCLLVNRRWKESWSFFVGSALAVSLSLPTLYLYVHRVSTLDGVTSAHSLPVWNVIASEFLAVRDLMAGSVLFFLLLVLSLIGCVRSLLDEGLQAIQLVIPVHLLIQLSWLFQVGRYFVWDWPIFLFFCAIGLRWIFAKLAGDSRSDALVGITLAGLLLSSSQGIIELRGFTVSHQPSIAEQRALYQWINAHLPESARVITSTPERFWLHASRYPIGVPLRGDNYHAVLRSIVQERVDYVVEEMFYSEKSYTPYPSRMDLWLERSSLFEKLFETGQDKVFRWKGDRASFLRANTNYLLAHKLLGRGQLAQSLVCCDRALEELEDFPEARHLRAVLGLQLSADLGQRPDPKDIALLEKELKQYPHDLAAATTLASAYAQSDRARALAVIESSLAEARTDRLPETQLLPLLQLRQQLVPR